MSKVNKREYQLQQQAAQMAAKAERAASPVATATPISSTTATPKAGDSPVSSKAQQRAAKKVAESKQRETSLADLMGY